jgi:hypothetical protein
MNYAPKLRTSFKKFKDADLDLVAAFIIISMKDNPNFLDPVPPIIQIEAALDIYRKALEAAKSRASLSVVNKNKARQVLESLLSDLALYIMSVAKGELAVLASTGFPLTKAPTPRSISDPGPVSLNKGKTSGLMDASVKPEKPAPGYLFQISSTDPAGEGETVWNSFGSTANKFTFIGLTAGSKYWVRVAAVGARGQQFFSSVISQFAL